MGIDRIFKDLANISEPFQLSLNSRLKIDSIAGISKLKNLTRLSLDGCNGLTEIPHDIDRLVNLKVLCIHGNNISSIPDSISRLKRLKKIDNIQIIYEGWREVGREPMMLLKMTCPSTAHIHILRVPPDMTRAEDAIVWVNHGIHPSKFAVQT